MRKLFSVLLLSLYIITMSYGQDSEFANDVAGFPASGFRTDAWE